MNTHPGNPPLGDASGFISPDLWRKLSSARSFSDLADGWIDLCRANLELVLGVKPGEIVVAFNSAEGANRHFRVAAYRGADNTPGAALTQVVQRSLVVRSGVATTNPEMGSGYVSNVIFVDDDLKGAVGVVLPTADTQRLNLAMRCLQWNAAWLAGFWRGEQYRDTAETVALRYGQHASSALLSCTDIEAGATSCATVMADDLVANRVTIGLVKGRHVRILGSSHTASVTAKSDRVHLIVDAMREAVYQNAPVYFSGAGSSSQTATESHAKLVEGREKAWVGSWPVVLPDVADGIIVVQIECNLDQSLRVQALGGVISGLVAPAFGLQMAASRSSFNRFFRRANRAMGWVFGLHHTRIKAIAALIVLLFAASLIIHMPYRVSAETEVQGLVQRAVPAPFDGFIAEGLVRAGDVVQKGDVLGRMETRELELHRFELQSSIVESQRKIEAATGEGDLSEARILRSRMQQAISELELVKSQLARTALQAPFSGYVIDGDLSQKIGSPVKEGDVLFELSPLHEYRLKLKVNEKDIRYIAVGQEGVLLLHARPNSLDEITVDRISPISEASDGENYFNVEALLLNPQQDLQPGMRGVAKVETQPKSIFWIYTHPLWDWARLQLWRILP